MLKTFESRGAQQVCSFPEGHLTPVQYSRLFNQFPRKCGFSECAREALPSSSEDFFVFLTINAVESSSIFGGHDSRKIELNWTPKARPEPTDWIGLFRSDPDIRLRGTLLRATGFLELQGAPPKTG